jgi:mRNA degradation ribonuclease J1/J2
MYTGLQTDDLNAVELVKPNSSAVHGEYRHLSLHAKLRMPWASRNPIPLLWKMAISGLTQQSAKISGRLKQILVYVDGLSVGDVAKWCCTNAAAPRTLAVVVIAIIRERHR